jgi:hypothetical protein
MRSSFIESAVEQGLLVNLLHFFGLALAYAVSIVAPAALVAARWKEARVATRFALAATVSALLYAVAQVWFQAAALYLRSVPHGSGIERQGADHEAFVVWAEVGFFTLLGLALLAAVGIGYALAPRGSASRKGLALATAGAALAFVGLTFHSWSS